MKKKISLISDFDGTISKKDFFYMVIDQILPPSTKDNVSNTWKDYIAGKIKHIDALSNIFSQIHLTQDNFDKFISTIEIDKYFYDTAKLCTQKNILFYICSAGSNYYIKKRIADIINKYKIILISNDAIYSKENGMKLIAPKKDCFYYHHNTGISKQAIVQKLKDEGYFTIYVGDGLPDFKAAKIADIIFAKDMLLDLCKKENIKTKTFNNFNDIINYITNI